MDFGRSALLLIMEMGNFLHDSTCTLSNSDMVMKDVPYIAVWHIGCGSLITG